MSYRLFLDDERFPPRDGNEWVICRTVREALAVLGERGYPSFVSFDHDLGFGEPTGLDLAKKFVELDLRNNWMDEGFDFYVHSQNPIGAENIRQLLNGYRRFKSENKRD